MKNIFTTVKAAVTTKQAAEYYGLKVSRNGMTCCPFHEDRHPSMKVDERYYCFGCHETGDVIDFTAKLFGLTPYEAAKKLAWDFHIDPNTPQPPVAAAMKKQEVQDRQDETWKPAICWIMSQQWSISCSCRTQRCEKCLYGR